MMKTTRTKNIGHVPFARFICRLHAIRCAGFVAAALAASTAANAVVMYSFTDLGTLGGTNSNALAINASGQVAGTAALAGDAASHAVVWNGTVATDLGAGASGGTYSAAYAINTSGTAAGVSHTASGSSHATVWNGTVATLIGEPSNAEFSAATGINASGQVAGVSYTVRGLTPQATVWNGTVAYVLGQLPGGSSSVAFGINASGQVAGSFNYYGNPVVWNDTVPTALGTLTGGGGTAFAINDSGSVAGWSTSAAGIARATVWNGTVPTYLSNVHGGTFSFALAINGLGQVAGQAHNEGDATSRAVVWNGTAAIDLNTVISPIGVDWVLSTARGINDRGQIVGQATNTLTGAQHAFLLTPVPEPENYLMMLAGLVAIVSVVRLGRAAVA